MQLYAGCYLLYNHDINTQQACNIICGHLFLQKCCYCIAHHLLGLHCPVLGLCALLLGLCPLLAVTTTAVSAIGLGIATLLVLAISSVLVSLLRRLILREVRIPIYILFIATLVTIVKFYVEAYYPDLNAQLGIYLSLIVTNCIIMGRAEAYAGRNNAVRSFFDAIGNGIGFMLVLLFLGLVREILGQGTAFMGASKLFGSFGKMLEYTLIPADYTLLVAILPPGGFFVVAFMIAFKNYIQNFGKYRYENSLKIKSVRR